MRDRLKRLISTLLGTLLATGFAVGAGPAEAQHTIKIMYRSAFGAVRPGRRRQPEAVAIHHRPHQRQRRRARQEVRAGLRSTTSPQPSDALIALKSATDQNMPFIMQCSGSNIAAALIEGVEKHNERNPDNRIIYLNCGAVATELTNEKCSFWHFRFDLHVGMKAEVMVRALPKDVTKVYLLNQDYLFGQSVQRDVKAYPRQAAARHSGRRRRVDPARQDQGFLALHHQDQGLGRAGPADRQLGPRHEPADQGRRRCRRSICATTPIYAHLAGGADRDRCRRRQQVCCGDGVQRKRGAGDRQQAEAEAFTRSFREKHKFDFSAAGFRTIFEYLAGRR